jgi:hypothetical protein
MKQTSGPTKKAPAEAVLGGCDEPDILLSQNTPVCLMGAEPGHFNCTATGAA